MESALNTAYSVLPTLTRDELKQLQSKISDLLLERENASASFIRPLSEKEWEVELDAAIADFDADKGYSSEEMCKSIRERFEWANL